MDNTDHIRYHPMQGAELTNTEFWCKIPKKSLTGEENSQSFQQIPKSCMYLHYVKVTWCGRLLFPSTLFVCVGVFKIKIKIVD